MITNGDMEIIGCPTLGDIRMRICMLGLEYSRCLHHYQWHPLATTQLELTACKRGSLPIQRLRRCWLF